MGDNSQFFNGDNSLTNLIEKQNNFMWRLVQNTRQFYSIVYLIYFFIVLDKFLPICLHCIQLYIQYTFCKYIGERYTFICTSFKTGREVECNFIFTHNACIMCYPAMLKSPKQNIWLNRAAQCHSSCIQGSSLSHPRLYC